MFYAETLGGGAGAGLSLQFPVGRTDTRQKLLLYLKAGLLGPAAEISVWRTTEGVIKPDEKE
jgi:hypothetical protein